MRIAKRIVKVKFISLVNLIADREIVKELIQDDFTAENVIKELRLILEGERSAQIKFDYQLLIEMLGESGASKRAAHIVDMFLRKKRV